MTKNRPVYTYSDIRKLEKEAYWDEIKGFPIISVSADFRKGLVGREEIDKTQGIFTGNSVVRACEIRKLMGDVLPGWETDETRFKQTVLLSQFLRERTHQSRDDGERMWLLGCRRNIESIRSAIIMLEEADFAESSFDDCRDKNLLLLRDAWNYLRSNDNSFEYFHSNLEKLRIRKNWDAVLCKLFDVPSIEGVIIQGFFYFTPIQRRLIDLIEDAGIKTIYLIHYDERYPYANEIWQRTYSKEQGYLSNADWVKGRIYDENFFGSLLEGNESRPCKPICVKEHGCIEEFVREIKRSKGTGSFIYSPNNKSANDMLKDFYPEEYGERKLLSYPVGQFVSTLNKVWNEDENRIILDEDSIVECFSSGWLSVDGLSGKQYIEDVLAIMPFFADCKTIKNWRNRIDLLKQIKHDVVEPFKTIVSVDEMESRWQEIMGNPLLNFGVFAVSDSRLDIILKLMLQIIEMAEDLFVGNKLIQVPDYIRKLHSILNKHEIANEMYDEERDIVSNLLDRLENADDFITDCAPSDIASALNLYMSGKFDEDELQSDKIGLVSPLYQIDAAPLRHKKIHVCLCDVKSMPGKNKRYIWPLTEDFVKGCYEKTKNPLIEKMIFIMESVTLCNRYFMYSAMINDNIQISWLSNNGEKRLAPSAYIKLMNENAGVEIIPSNTVGITYKQVEQSEFGNAKIENYDLDRMPRLASKEAKMDYALCPMRYLLGYVLDDQPAYTNAFHQNYAINALIMAIFSLMSDKGMSLEEIYNQVISLFPAMRNAEKKQVYDYLNSNDEHFQDLSFSTSAELVGLRYTDERLKVRFPNKDIRNKAMSAYSKLYSPEGQSGMDLYKKIGEEPLMTNKKKPVIACEFCPHQDYCRNASLLEKQEELYDR